MIHNAPLYAAPHAGLPHRILNQRWKAKFSKRHCKFLGVYGVLSYNTICRTVDWDMKHVLFLYVAIIHTYIQ